MRALRSVANADDEGVAYEYRSLAIADFAVREISWARHYEQNHRPLADYRSDDDRRGWDGVTVQWFDSMEDFQASLREEDLTAST